MIRLQLPPKPVQLTAEMQRELTEQFKKDNNKAVWKKEWIIQPLSQMTHSKCSFSEVKLGEEGKYLEIEHIHPKSKYPDEVVEWGNMLPICNFCNRKKSSWNTKEKPLVNPMVDDPKDYFCVTRTGRLIAKNNNKKAKDTIDAYNLNNYDQLQKVRLELILNIGKHLRTVLVLIDSNKTDDAITFLKNILLSCGRENSYSAYRSAYVLSSEVYLEIKGKLVKLKLWDSELIVSEEEMKFCALPIAH